MEHYKIYKLLNDSTASISVTKKMDRSKSFMKWPIFCFIKNIRSKTSMLRSDFCDYSNVCIFAKGKITVEGDNDDKIRNKKLIFKSNAPFRSCISKINNTFRDNAEELDVIMPMYNLLEYRDNYSMTSRSLRSYYRDEIYDSANENNDDGNKINNNKTITSKSLGNMQNHNI